MFKTKLDEYLADTPVIAAVQETAWKDAINSPARVIFCLKANLMTIKEKIEEAHKYEKLIFVHLDLADGIGKDKTGIEFLAKCGVDGVITTRGNLVRFAKEKGLITVQRFFALDSQGVSGIEDLIAASNPDYVEIMPGVIEKIISNFAKGSIPIIAGGLIENKSEVTTALSCGAIAVSTGRKDLWYIQMGFEYYIENKEIKNVEIL